MTEPLLCSVHGATPLARSPAAVGYGHRRDGMGEHGLDRRRTLKVEGTLGMAQELGELGAGKQGMGDASFQQEGVQEAPRAVRPLAGGGCRIAPG